MIVICTIRNLGGITKNLPFRLVVLNVRNLWQILNTNETFVWVFFRAFLLGFLLF